MRKTTIYSIIVITAVMLAGCLPSFNPQAEEHFRQGLEFERQAQHDRAMEEFTRAIQLDPEYYYAYYNRALTYYRLGELEKSLADYSKAIDLHQENAFWVFERGFVYWEYGDADRAIADFEKAVELGLPPDDRKRAESAIEQLKRSGPENPPDECGACPG